MKSKTICEAAIHVLSQSKKELTIQEIYSRIVEDKLYQFNAANPISVLRSTLIKHCLETTNKNQSTNKYFKLIDNNKFKLID
jgi:hypothetical protein